MLLYTLILTSVWLTYLIIMSHNGSQTGERTLVPHLCCFVHGATSYKRTVMIEQAVTYFFWVTTKYTYSSANNTGN
jgi:hypothetical protein